MAPNTALAFFIGSLALISHSCCKNDYQKIMSIALSLLVFIIGLIALFGYFAQLPTAYAWEKLTAMALHTASGFILFGVGSFFLSWSSIFSDKKMLAKFMPILILLMGFVFFLLFWQSLVMAAHHKLVLKAKNDAYSMVESIQKRLEAHGLAFIRIYRRTAFRESASEAHWRLDAGDFVRDIPYYEGIAWVNSQRKQFWIEVQKNESSQVAQKKLLECYQKIKNSKIDSQKPKVKFFELNLDNICMVIFSSKGSLVALMNTPLFIKENIQYFKDEPYQIFLSQQNQLLMIHDDKRPALSGEWKQILSLSTISESLDFVVWPTQGFLDENKTFYPHFFLISGFALTLFLALSFYFWVRIKRQADLLSKEILRSERLESRFKALSTSAKDAIIVCNARGQVIFWNPMASMLFQFLEEEAIGKYIYDLIVPSQYIKKYRTDFQKFRKTGRWVLIGKTIEILAKKKDGREFPIEISISAMTSNGVPEATAIIRDISERKRAEATIHHQANYDALTDLANRHLFEDRLRQALANSDRTSSLSAVMVIDIDDFKLVNDRYGHQSGDELLGLLAQRLVESIRSTDTAARMGGDEFVVILTNIRNKTEITLSVDKIVKKLSTPYVIQGKNFSSSVSIGVAIYPENASNADELMKKADLAMYVAKRRGKNQLVYAESD